MYVPGEQMADPVTPPASSGGGGTENQGSNLPDPPVFNATNRNANVQEAGRFIGGAIGSVFGRIGTAVGSFIGAWLGCIIFCKDEGMRVFNVLYTCTHPNWTNYLFCFVEYLHTDPPDTTPPTITCPAVQTPIIAQPGQRSREVTYPSATATDNEGVSR